MDATARARELALAGIEMRINTGHITSGDKGGQFAPKGYSGGGGSGAFSGQYQSGPKTNPAPKAKAPSSSVLSAPQGKRTLKKGDTGDDVRYMQYALGLLGFQVRQDGLFDASTEQQIKVAQRRLGVAETGHLSPSMLKTLQDAVRLSPCVQQSRDVEFEADWERRDDETTDEPDEEDDEDGGSIADEPGDDLADDETDALIQAIDAYVGAPEVSLSAARQLAVLGIEVRAHDVSAELRIPGGKGGGRWTKSPVTNAIAHALAEWGKGNGPDDPFQLDGKPIDREPLRKAAVARGITLKRGASRDDIARALLDDVRAEKAGTKKPSREDVTFSLSGPGRKNMTAVVYQNSKGELFLRRETVPGHPDAQAITSQPDLASFEKWANDNGEPGLAKWARGEIDKKTPAAPAKAAKKAAPPSVEAAGTVRAEGYVPHADVELRVVADGKGGYKLQRRPRGGAWQDDPNGHTGNTPKDITSRFPRAQWTTVRAPAVKKAAPRKASPAKVAKAAPDLEQAARDRQARIDKARGVAGMLAEADQLHHDQASPQALEHRIRSAGKSGGVAPEVTDELAKASRERTPGDFEARVGVARTGEAATAAAPVGGGSVDSGLTQAQKDAFASYISFHGYRRINGQLRSGELDAKTTDQVRVLDGAMDASPLSADVVVHRGMRDGEVIFGGRFGGDLAGAEWTEPAYVSTFPNANSAENWSRHGLGSDNDPLHPVAMRILAPQGTHAVRLDERELLLDRGLALRVAADHGEKGGIRRLDVEVVPKSGNSLPAAADRIAAQHGLKRVTGPAGTVEPFNPDRHELPTGAPRPEVGAPVTVWKPGYEAHGIDEKPVTVAKATVYPAEEAKVPLSTAPAMREVQVENRIRAAYTKHKLPGGYAPLADVRKELSDIPRAEQDAVLRKIATEPGTHVIPWDNRKALTTADHEAALHFGGDANHVIRFEDASPKPLPATKSDPLAGLEGLTTVQKRAAALAAQRLRMHVGPQEATPGQIDHVANAVAQLTVPQLRQLMADTNVDMPKIRGRQPTRQDLEYALFEGIVGHARRQGFGQVAPALDDLAHAANGAHENPVPARPDLPRLGVAEKKQSGLASLIESARKPGESGEPARKTLADLEAKGTIRREGDTWVFAEAKSDPLVGLEGLTQVQKRAALRKRGLSKAEIDGLAPLEKKTRAKAARMLEFLGVTRALGHDVTPGHDELHHYWTVGKGLARWIGSPHQFTTLRDQLVEEAHVTPEVADRWAAAWVHEVTGFWPGSDMHRVLEGGKPRGHRIGRG